MTPTTKIAIASITTITLILAGCTDTPATDPGPETLTIVFHNNSDEPADFHLWDEVPGDTIMDATNVQPGDTPEQEFTTYESGTTQFFKARVNAGGQSEEAEGDVTLEDDTMFIGWDGQAISIGF